MTSCWLPSRMWIIFTLKNCKKKQKNFLTSFTAVMRKSWSNGPNKSWSNVPNKIFKITSLTRLYVVTRRSWLPSRKWIFHHTNNNKFFFTNLPAVTTKSWLPS